MLGYSLAFLKLKTKVMCNTGLQSPRAAIHLLPAAPANCHLLGAHQGCIFVLRLFLTGSGISSCLAFTTDRLKIVSSKEWRGWQGPVCVWVTSCSRASLGTSHCWLFGSVSPCHFPPSVYKEKSIKRIKWV